MRRSTAGAWTSLLLASVVGCGPRTMADAWERERAAAGDCPARVAAPEKSGEADRVTLAVCLAAVGRWRDSVDRLVQMESAPELAPETRQHAHDALDDVRAVAPYLSVKAAEGVKITIDGEWTNPPYCPGDYESIEPPVCSVPSRSIRIVNEGAHLVIALCDDEKGERELARRVVQVGSETVRIEIPERCGQK
jgi:hypothetical protein